MTIIPFQSLQLSPPDSQTLLIYWGPFQAGDEGQLISVYAWPSYAWHFTGYPTNPYDNMNPPTNIPIMPDRTMTILASNDKACWGPVHTFDRIDAAGMNARINDPMRSNPDDGKYVYIKPKAGGSINPAGPDCGLLLFCARQLGPRI